MAAGQEGTASMTYAGAPTSVRSLEQRIRNLEGDDDSAGRWESEARRNAVNIDPMLPLEKDEIADITPLKVA